MVKQIRRKVRGAQWRLHWISLCRRFLVTLAAASLVMALYVLLSRLFPLRVKPLALLPWVGGVAGAWVILWTWLRRYPLLETAVRIDEALGLKERLSTALTIKAPRNEAEAAVIEDAVEHARRIRPAQAFPMNMGRPFGRAFAALAVLVAIWLFMPQYDLLAHARARNPEQSPVAVEARKEAVQQLENLAKELGEAGKTDTPQVAQKLDHDLNALARQIKDEKLTGEQAAAKMEKLGEKINQRRDEIEKMMEKAASLQTRGEGRSTSPIAKALQKGEFAKAAKALDDLKKELQSNKLTPEQQQAVAKELQQMAGQMGKDSPLGEALSQAAQKMEEGQMNGAMSKLEECETQMKDLEGMLAEMKQLDGLKEDMEAHKMALTGQMVPCENCGKPCLGGLCESCAMARGEWKPGDSRKQGLGMGGPGIGQGAIAESSDGPTAFQKKLLPGEMTPGQILARMKVPGQQPPGEIKTEFEALRMQSSQAAEDTIKTEQLPLERKTLVRQYFDAIKYEKGETPAAAPAAGSPAAAPAKR